MKTKNNIPIKQIKKEKKIVTEMITLYCKKKHKTSNTLCSECEDLDKYSKKRIDSCPFFGAKPFCSNCRVHCYSEGMKNKIIKVMRFSGPYMMLYHPVIAICHLIDTKKRKKFMEKQNENKN